MTDETQQQPASPFLFEEAEVRPEVKWRETLRIFCANRAALLGFILVTLFAPQGIIGWLNKLKKKPEPTKPALAEEVTE